jgi:hypothetical protein
MYWISWFHVLSNWFRNLSWYEVWTPVLYQGFPESEAFLVLYQRH